MDLIRFGITETVVYETREQPLFWNYMVYGM